ncbi:hypothetical protein [Halobacteriovorax sp. HLS]|uniref:hypothetical protein n=1 Tax=Halobacteriovorax sp. HLS TaxID=2234000 RepID=UPI000FDA9A22|nr:hypothetical protein [Halobacteriovorax sp. HLS]
MSTSNETTTNSETEIKFDHKGLMRSSFRSSTKTLSLKPTRSFGRAKSLRPKAVLSTKKEEIKDSQD